MILYDESAVRKLCEDAIEAASDHEEEEDGGLMEPLDFGGNQDDALDYGRKDGALRLAREILKHI